MAPKVPRFAQSRLHAKADEAFISTRENLALAVLARPGFERL
jgi:hypothetical protein